MDISTPSPNIERLKPELFALKIQVFFFIRIALGLFCAACETVFYRGVSRRFGSRVGLLALLFLITSAGLTYNCVMLVLLISENLFLSGMFISSTGNLPNTFSMYGILLAFGAWFSGYHFRAVVASGFGVILGWPFVAVAFLPMGLDIFLQHGPIKVSSYLLLLQQQYTPPLYPFSIRL